MVSVPRGQLSIQRMGIFVHNNRTTQECELKEQWNKLELRGSHCKDVLNILMENLLIGMIAQATRI